MIRRCVLSLLLSVSPALALAQDVGVTAAVNQDAQAFLPGGAARTIELGDTVVFNQRIDTDAAGLVQILLADGTAFTVGPNSSMTIDSFVYDPQANTASVAASVTKGFVRFIGGRTSKNEGGATIETPMGTAGIRGAVANINVSGESTVPPHISLIFGDAITLTAPGGSMQTVSEAGLSLVVEGGQTQVRQTPPEFIAAMQQALAPRPGTNGGATTIPTNQSVQRSGVAQSNSGYGSTALSVGGYVGTYGDFDAAAAWMEVQDLYAGMKDFFEQNPGYVDPDADPDAPTFMFAPVRVLTAATYDDGNGGVVLAGRGVVEVRADDAAALYYGFNGADGVIQFEDGRVITVPFRDDQDYGTIPVAGSYPGTLHIGRNEFRAYMLKDGGGNPVYAITGYAAAVGEVLQNGEIWRYRLSADPLAPLLTPDGVAIPFADGVRLADFSSANAASGDLYLAATPGATDGVIGRGLQAWLAISGSGAGQTSAIGVTLGSVRNIDQAAINEDNQLSADHLGVHFTGSRGGGERRANGSQTASFGSVGTQPSGERAGGFLGAGGENIVIGTNSAGDSWADPGFGTIHVGTRAGVINGPAAARSDGTMTGFASGVGRLQGADTRAMRGTIELTFDATRGTLTGTIDAEAADSGGPTEWTFFNRPEQSAYVSKDLFAAQQDGNGSYLVSSGAVPTPNTALCNTCDYLQWGWWGESPGFEETEIDSTHMGNWVIGDVTDVAEMPTTGTATYSGNAIGTVLNNGAQYIATGTMAAEANFGTRTGSVTISDFDGRPDFGSSFSSLGAAFSGTSGDTAITGAFVGPNAANIMGNFVTTDGSWSASGIFGGAQ